MSFFRSIGEAIGRRAARQAVDEYFTSEKFKDIADSAIRKILAEPKYAWFHFVKLIQAELQRVDPTLPDRRAFYMARDAYLEHLKGEKIEFGDPRYAWDADGARDLAHAYEIDHWEARP